MKELYVFYNQQCITYKEHDHVIDEFASENDDVVVVKFDYTHPAPPPTTYHVQKFGITQSPTYVGVVDGSEIDRTNGQPSKFVLRSLLG